MAEAESTVTLGKQPSGQTAQAGLEAARRDQLSGKTGGLRCQRCNAPRALSPCHKCGGELTAAA
jgi:hypothetical protein